jgi:hypothetical protein
MIGMATQNMVCVILGLAKQHRQMMIVERVIDPVSTAFGAHQATIAEQAQLMRNRRF